MYTQREGEKEMVGRERGKKEKAKRHFEEQGIICPANKTFLNWILN